ncbi:hypothetical protein D9758_007315 [Tetrapyrgos nigripes]|uniref:Uncharacterized protein n=1 Tax=Tetrapyrgos nigripes TaxID=182062 RepID=A0A8H5GBD6_9AGAR|nr:hypothetical protein D9758_007315 [Tetrapyrgos nigripes]
MVSQQKPKPSTRCIIEIQRFCLSGYTPGITAPTSPYLQLQSDFSPNNSLNSSSSDGKGKEPKSKANGSWPTEKRDCGLRHVVVGSGPSSNLLYSMDSFNNIPNS